MSSRNFKLLCCIIQKDLFSGHPRLSVLPRRGLTSLNDDDLDDSLIQPKQKTSKAMRAYLERSRQHDEFMKQQILDYNIGKRHLANMMGEDPDTFTQKDIDESIQYLFPSGLFEPKARPFMKEPHVVFPPRKAAEFDLTGRPHHPLFYTGSPNFYQLLYDIVEHINSLNAFEDMMIRKQQKPDENAQVDIFGSEWIPQKTLESQLVEPLHESQYKQFITVMERLLEHPYAYKQKDFILSYRKPLVASFKVAEVIKPEYDEDGRSFVTVKDCTRKTARGEVTIRSPGTGKFSVNGSGIDYFVEKQQREQILFPLIFTNMIGKVDVEATVSEGGMTSQAGAVRWGISWGLRSYVDEETVERMNLAGLLTRDLRKKERKKPGQEGARRKYTWKKR